VCPMSYLESSLDLESTLKRLVLLASLLLRTSCLNLTGPRFGFGEMACAAKQYILHYLYIQSHSLTPSPRCALSSVILPGCTSHLLANNLQCMCLALAHQATLCSAVST
jgi:hypothetical protein